jgi:hypothetical protein
MSDYIKLKDCFTPDIGHMGLGWQFSEGLLYEIHADNPEWSKWKPFEMFKDATENRGDGDIIMEQLESLMGMPRQCVPLVSE